MNSTAEARLNCWLVGLIALGSLIAGLLVAIADSIENLWCAGFLRVGILMGAFWLAMPTKGRAAAWANIPSYWIFVVAALLFVVRRPQILIPFVLAILFLTVVMPLFTRQRK